MTSNPKETKYDVLFVRELNDSDIKSLEAVLRSLFGNKCEISIKKVYTIDDTLSDKRHKYTFCVKEVGFM